MMPIPTVIREVQARAAAAEATPLSLKQSSQTHNSSKPAASTSGGQGSKPLRRQGRHES